MLPAFEAAAVVLAVAALLLPVAPAAVERWYSTGIYPSVQRTITPFANAIPVALLDLLSGAAVVIVAIVVVRAVRAAARVRRPRPVVAALAHLAVAAAVAYLIFLALWGLNYRRIAMPDRLVVASGSPSPDAVVKLGLRAASQLNSLHEAAHRAGWSDPPWQNDSLRRAFDIVQHELSDAIPAEPGRLKQSVFGPYFRWTSVDGMINPFGLEVLVNPDLLPFERPFVAAHEWAHLAGYADESEASFVGWLTCMRADAASQYSGWLALYWQVNGEINASERRQLASALAAGPQADVDAVVKRVRRGEWPWLRTAGWRVYDEYLKANRVEEGVRSYGAVITLILRARFDDGWVPVRRVEPVAPKRPGS